MKLIIKDSGDYSVGIMSAYWEVEVPFNKDELSGDELEMNLEGFRKDMIKAYEDYCEGRCSASYDFEIEADEESEEETLKLFDKLIEADKKYEAENPVVMVLLKDIVKSDAACEWLGLNPWCVNEGCDGNAKYGMTLRKAKEFGLIK